MDSNTQAPPSMSQPEQDQPVPPVPSRTPSNLSIAKVLAYGFAIASFGITIALIGYFLTYGKRTPPVEQKQKTVISVTPQTTPVQKAAIKILGIQETANGIIFTTDVPTYMRVNFWYDPKLVNTNYGDGYKTQHEFSSIDKGGAYQIIVYQKDPSDGVKSEVYSFEGNRIAYPQEGMAGEKSDIVPLHALQFTKKVVDADNCNNPVGLITYVDAKSNSTMKIHPGLTDANKDIQSAISDLLRFLDTNKQNDFQNISSLGLVFHDYCGGAADLFIRELSGISYPKTDTVKAVMELSGQAPLSGIVTVVVYAQKGNNLLQLGSTSIGENIVSQYKTDCAASKFNDDYNLAEKCYREKIVEDPTLQAIAKNKLQELVTLFSF